MTFDEFTKLCIVANKLKTFKDRRDLPEHRKEEVNQIYNELKEDVRLMINNSFLSDSEKEFYKIHLSMV